MFLYGILNSISRDVDGFSASRDEAERKLAAILKDELEA